MSSHVEKEEPSHIGRCLCGKISYEVKGQPILTSLCHCDNCKKWTGAGFGWYAFFNKEQIQYTQGQDDLHTYVDADTNGGSTLLRNFCGTCGSSVTVVMTARQGMTGIAAATFEIHVREAWAPQVESYCKRRVHWLPHLGVKQFEAAPTVA